jgi:hypothetical protein
MPMATGSRDPARPGQRAMPMATGSRDLARPGQRAMPMATGSRDLAWPGQRAMPMACLIVSGSSSTLSMYWATSARGTDRPPRRFWP